MKSRTLTPSRDATPPAARRPSRRRGFSIIEMLVALAISATLLTATLAALDASFKSYKSTTDSVSTHVVGRLVMHRLASLVRNGENFGPYPVNPILTPKIESTSIQFEVHPDPYADVREVWTIERVSAVEPNGPYALTATVERYEDGELADESTRTLVRRVHDATFTLEYDVGPRLRRATIDFTLTPDDDQADRIGSSMQAPPVRMVATVAPRRLDIE